MNEEKKNLPQQKQDSDTPELEIQRLRELLNQREVEMLISSQKEFNRFMLREVFQMEEDLSNLMIDSKKIQEDINLIGETLQKGNSEEPVEEPEEEPEPEPVEKPRLRGRPVREKPGRYISMAEKLQAKMKDAGQGIKEGMDIIP